MLPFVSTKIKLWRGALVLQHEEVINVPVVDLGFTADVANLLNKQRLRHIITFSNHNSYKLNTKNTTIVNKESRRLLLQRREGYHA